MELQQQGFLKPVPRARGSTAVDCCARVCITNVQRGMYGTKVPYAGCWFQRPMRIRRRSPRFGRHRLPDYPISRPAAGINSQSQLMFIYHMQMERTRSLLGDQIRRPGWETTSMAWSILLVTRRLPPLLRDVDCICFAESASFLRQPMDRPSSPAGLAPRDQR
ncbi:hypothetical protein VTK56DRAFT_332 [Thermocarpiscus australiensis]